MSDAPDDLGIPMRPARNNSGQNAPGQNATVAPLSRAASPVPARPADPMRAAQEALRPADSGPRPTAALAGSSLPASPLAGGPLAPPRRNDERSAQADRRPRDHAVRRDKLVRQACHRRQRRSQSAELHRGRTGRIGSVQGLGDDRRDRRARPLRGHSDRAQAARDPRHRAGVRARSATARSRSSAAARFRATCRRMPATSRSRRRKTEPRSDPRPPLTARAAVRPRFGAGRYRGAGALRL